MRAFVLLIAATGLAFGAGPGGYWGGGPGGLPSGFTLTGTIQALNLTATNNVRGNDVSATDSLTAVTGNFSGIVTGAATAVFTGVSNATGYWATGSGTQAGYNCGVYGGTPFVRLGSSAVGGSTVIGGVGDDATSKSFVVSPAGFSSGLLNLVYGPTFGAATGWTLVGCSITGGKLQKLTAAGVGTATQSPAAMPLVTGATYLVHIDCDSLSTGHDITLSLGGTAFGTITAEGADQWFRAAATNTTGGLIVAWADGETGVVDNLYAYRLAPRITFGGSVWNVAWTSTATAYTVQEGDHVLSVSHADSMVVTLPALSTCWDAVTATGRELIIENAGTGFCVITTPAGDASLNAIAGGDSLHLAQYAVATLRAVSASHWAVAE